MKQLLNWFCRGDLEKGLDRELRGSHGPASQRPDCVGSARVGNGEEGERRWSSAVWRKCGGVSATCGSLDGCGISSYDLRFSAFSFTPPSSFTGDGLLSLTLGIGPSTRPSTWLRR